MEIDMAAELLCDAAAFAEAVSVPAVSEQDAFTSLERPAKRFRGAGGCPCYMGRLNYGSGSNVICSAVKQQLHGYVAVKLCEGGRKAYCPIWRAELGRDRPPSKAPGEQGIPAAKPDVSNLDTSSGGEEAVSHDQRGA